MPKSIILSTVIALGLSACAIGPNYHAPKLTSPASWIGLGQGIEPSEQQAGTTWWNTFNDATLNMLMTEAVKNNGDLKIATARVTEARAQRLASFASLMPSIGGVGSGQRGTLTTGGVGNTHSLGFEASWELDLFGGNRRAYQSARANVQAVQASLRNVHISLLAQVAQTYLTVRQAQQQISLTSRNLDIQKETLRIVNVQFREGVVDKFDVSRAEAQVATTAAQLPALQQFLVANMGTLGVLVGAQPAQIQGMIGASETIATPSAPVFLASPATVLAKRPDVAVAERQLAAATANQGVAMSNWLPKVNLGSFFGLAYTPATGSNESWNVGGTVRLPLINFGQVRALVKTAKARQQIALANYEQTVLAALADVETALSGYLTAQEQLKQLETATEANRTAVTLARARYREGTTALLDVLTAEQSLLASEISLADSRAAVGQAYAGLYRALGSGE